ncbi:MAG: hypothetical protein ACRDFB_10125, partial [Rhabdochlamydiaceae bacterium]
ICQIWPILRPYKPIRRYGVSYYHFNLGLACTPRNRGFFLLDFAFCIIKIFLAAFHPNKLLMWPDRCLNVPISQ